MLRGELELSLGRLRWLSTSIDRFEKRKSHVLFLAYGQAEAIDFGWTIDRFNKDSCD